jgi:hypothetical protein
MEYVITNLLIKGVGGDVTAFSLKNCRLHVVGQGDIVARYFYLFCHDVLV